MSTVVLIQAQPRLASNGSTQTVRMAGGGSRPYTQLGVNDWRSGVASRPRFTTAIAFGKGGPTGGAIPQTTAIRFASSDKSYTSALSNVVWPGARITIATGDDEAIAPAYTTILLGTVADATLSAGSITLTVADLSADLNKPAAPNTFAGSGDLEGADAATGRTKRRTFGVVFNVEGRVLDPATNVYEFGDPAYSLSSFDLLKDKGQSGPMTVLQWQGSALATLNALKAATVTKGGGVVAPSIACAKWWTIPAGPLTADITATGANGNTPAGIATTIAPLFAPAMTIANTAEAVGWVNYSAGVHIDDASETVGNVLDRLLLPVFIAWVLTGAGALVFRRISFAAPVATLRADTIDRETVFPALKTRKLGFQRNYRVHSDGEISAALLTATDVTYADGTPIEVLKPLEAGANVTEARTAAAIAGQGLGATAARADIFNDTIKINPNGQLTGGGGGQVTYGGLGGLALGLLNNLFFGSPNLLESSGGPVASLNAFKTLLGNAAGFTGQTAFATLASGTSLDNSIFGMPSRMVPYTGDPNFLAASRMAWNEGGTVQSFKPAEGGANVTETRTSAGFTGQTAFATLAAGTSLDNSVFGMPARMVPYSGDANFLAASRMSWNEGGTVQSLKPGESGANITEKRVSSGFVGQTIFATLAAGTSLDNAAFGMPARMTPYPGDVNFLSAARMSWTQGGTVQSLKPGEAGANVTETRVASAFTGQTVFATLPSGTSLDNAAFGMPARMVPYSGDSNFLAASRMSWNEGGTVQGLKPGEAGANVTEMRTSSGIAGQGFLATQNSADFATRITGAEKPANNASSDIILRPLGNVPPTITGNTVKGNSAGSWTGYALSNGIAGGARTRALVGGGCMFGLTGNAGVADGNNTFQSITYAVYNSGSRWYVYTGGNQIADLGTGYTPSTVWEWTHDGSTIRLFASGGTSPVFSTTLNFNGILYAACAFAFAEAVSQITVSAYADITRNNTAAGFFNQAALATLNQVTFNTTTIKRADGTTIVSETLVVTELGVASAFTGQGSLATLNQAGTAQIAANAVSNVLGATGDVVNVAASDTASGVSISTTCAGGAIKIDVCFDASRSSGAGQCMAQLFATYNGQTIALGRQFNCPVQVNSPPVALFVNTQFNAGTAVKFEMRYTTTTSAFQISGQAMTYTELKR